MENQEENFNENDEQQEFQDLDEGTSLASDGPVSKNEGDGGADLNETDVIPGSEDAIDDIEINPDDDINTDVDEDDLQALDGLDEDQE